MEFLMLSEKEKEIYNNDILKLLEISDNEFVPPLSKRYSTTQQNLKSSENSGDGGVLNYHKQVIKQCILGAFEGNKLLGFVSFKENVVTDIIKTTPNIYISTLVLHPDARGKNLTFKMYDYLFNELYKGVSVFTRTWSSNAAHIKILSKFNFSQYKIIENDRGEGIDTIYFSLLH